jgi:hypothetical protein
MAACAFNRLRGEIEQFAPAFFEKLFELGHTGCESVS